MATTQAHRRLRIETIHKAKPGGDDPFLLVMAQCSEAFSTPYYIDVVMYARKDTELEFAPYSMINTPATVTVRIENLQREGAPQYRYATRKGVFQSFQHMPRQHRSLGTDYDVYSGRLVPLFMMMDKQVRYRIFENVTIWDLFSQCAKDFKGDPLQNYFEEYGPCKADWPTMETCTQYGESTYNMLARLMNRFSMWYFFDHERPGPHETMLIGYTGRHGLNMNFPDCAIVENYPDQYDLLKPLTIDSWRLVTGITRLITPAPRLSRTSDFNIFAPARPMQSVDSETLINPTYDTINNSDGSDKPGADTSFVLEAFPDSTISSDDDATDDAAVTLRAAESQVFSIQGAGANASFAAGKKFHLMAGADNPHAGTYLILQMSFNAYDRFYLQILKHDSPLFELFDDMLAAPIFGLVNQLDSSRGPNLANALSNAGLQNYLQTWVNAPPDQKPSFPPPYSLPGALTYLASFLPTVTTVLQDLVGILKDVLEKVLAGLIEIITVLADIVLFFPDKILNLFGVKNVRKNATDWLHRLERSLDKIFDNILKRDDDAFAASFVATKFQSAYGIPMPVANKAQVSGPHLATVIGTAGIAPESGTILADALGRVRVRFPWDRTPAGMPDAAGNQDKPQFLTGTSTAWVRVSDAWAGRGFGAQFLPRIGQEVIVSFIDGDPDRPIITGRVYNADTGVSNLPFPSNPAAHIATYSDLHGTASSYPVPLSGIKTSSVAPPNKPAASGYHLLRFDDTSGNEQLLLRSQGRMDTTAKVSHFDTTIGNRHLLCVAGLDPKTNQTVQGSLFITTGKPHFGIPPNGNYDLHVGGSRYEQVDGVDGYQLTVKKDTQFNLQQNCSGVIGGVLSLGASSIVLEAAQKITLKVGSNTIVINAGGVHIDGLQVPKQAGGPADEAAAVTMKDVLDAIAADPGEPANTRAGGSGGSGGGSGPQRSETIVFPPQSLDTSLDDDDMLSVPA